MKFRQLLSTGREVRINIINAKYQELLLHQRKVRIKIINTKYQEASLYYYHYKVPRTIIILLSMQSISHYHQREISIKNISSKYHPLLSKPTKTTFNQSPIVFIFFFLTYSMLGTSHHVIFFGGIRAGL